MEGYAVAYVCQRLGVPVRLVKHVSDPADDSALDWPSRVDVSARALGAWVAIPRCLKPVCVSQSTHNRRSS